MRLPTPISFRHQIRTTMSEFDSKPANLSHIIYSSTATRPMGDAELVELLETARAANAEVGLTGMLLHDSGSFFQVLEGGAADVERVFARIGADTRHEGIVKIIQEPISRRAFGDWTMGFASLTRAELASLAGMNDFFGNGSSFCELGAGRAKKLLAAFRAGRWRGQAAAVAPGRTVAPARA